MRIETNKIKKGTIRRVKKFALVFHDISYKNTIVTVWMEYYNEVQIYETRILGNKFGHRLPVTDWYWLRNEEC